MSKSNKKFLSRYYTIFGCLGCLVAFFDILAIIFVSTGILRIKYNMFGFLVVPNLVSKLLIAAWLYYYTYSTSYGKDIRELAKMMMGVLAINVMFVMLDESTVTYYLIQAIANLALIIFMCIMISRCRYASRNKKYATLGFVTSTVLYIVIAFNVVIISMSFSNHDPYLITFTGVSHFMTFLGIIFVNLMERTLKHIPKGE